MHIKSESIKIFPLAKPRSKDSSSRLFYEDNIANIIRQVTSGNGFIINAPTTLSTYNGYYRVNQDLEFNIYGYYVKITKSSNIISVSDTNKNGTNYNYIYAKIKLNNSTTPEINGQDDGGNYTGLEILSGNTLPSDTDTEKYLKLFTNNDNKFVIDSGVGLLGTITGIDGKVN